MELDMRELPRRDLDLEERRDFCCACWFLDLVLGRATDVVVYNEFSFFIFRRLPADFALYFFSLYLVSLLLKFI